MMSRTRVSSFAISLNRLKIYLSFFQKTKKGAISLWFSSFSPLPCLYICIALCCPDNGMVGCTDRDVLDEVEIRQLLIDHVGHRCCWGSRPARTWNITSIEDCNVYVGTLETFIEERDIVTKKEPYESGKIDGRDKGPVLGVWELDLRSEFPLLFIPEKEVMVKIPHSEVVEKCSGKMSYFAFVAI